MRKILKNKKGFTLMELIVGMVIFAIISISISMVLTPTLSAFRRANDFAEYNALLDNIANQIIGDLSQSVREPDFEPDVDIDDNVLTIHLNAKVVRYYINNGVLWREVGDTAMPVFTEDFYHRKSLSIAFAPVDADDTDFVSYTLTITIRENGGAGFEVSRDYVIRPLLLNQLLSQEEEDDEG